MGKAAKFDLKDGYPRTGLTRVTLVRRSAFTLIELLVVISIFGILTSLLLPCLARGKRKARAIEELSSARQLMLAAHVYADENEGAIFPGYVADSNAKDNVGEPLKFPINARYPWRLSPYLGQSFDTIYCSENRRQLEHLRKLDRDAYVYEVSLYPSLGINSYFVGGNQTEFLAEAANNKFGAGTVVQKMNDVRRPSELMMFVSARSSNTGLEANGYFQVTPPYLNVRKWANSWSEDLPAQQWGFVSPRYDGRAVTAMVDGHAGMSDQSELQDMRRWSNTADRPDYTLKVSP